MALVDLHAMAFPAFGGTRVSDAKDYVSIERLLLPLAKDGRHVEMLLAMTFYTRWLHPAGVSFTDR